MRNKNKLTLFIFLSMIAIGCDDQIQKNNLPQPTEETAVKADMEEGSKRKARLKWIELLHQSADSIYWRNIESDRAWQNHLNKQQSKTSIQGNEIQSLAHGELKGKWIEKGSDNQAGSVIATTYHSASDALYLISAGGSLFKGNRDGSNWEVVNQTLRFNGSLLDFIDGPNGDRLIAFIEGVPSYSDDYGQNWQPCQDWIEYNDNWGNVYHPVISADSQTIITLAKPSYWSALNVYCSIDKGQTYREVLSLGSHETNKYKLCKVNNSNEIFLIERVANDKIDIYKFDEDSLKFELINFVDGIGFGENGRANMSIAQVNDSTKWMYFYDNDNKLYFSSDNGVTWKLRGSLPVAPWGVGIYVSPTDPEFLLLGAVECFRSHDGGQSWEKLNNWGEYYSNIESKLHADMMYFREYVTPTDTFTAISNHGGLSLSYDSGLTTNNISLQGLNVSQYYSVRTDPLSPDYIYAGSQDQGFQRAIDQEYGPVSFAQTISGDYGHIIFSENDKRLWSVYPGGWVIYYHQPHQGNYPSLSFDLESEDESVWLPPLAESGRKDKNEVFLAGGNINGGSGSHLIKLEVVNNQIIASQFEFDFKNDSEGEISAIHNPQQEPNTLYVATTNGTFYTSEDFGISWEKAAIQVPGSHYLYGATIISSQKNPEQIYVGGSGYSTAPVIFSFNGGKTFIPLSNGLPSTTVFDLDIDEEEKYLFAATEAGPYVFVFNQNRWYPMHASVAPNQTYWSVDYVPARQIVRFGTYGRGIWDFVIEETTAREEAINSRTTWTIFPNPAYGKCTIQLLESTMDSSFKIFDIQGKLIQTGEIRGNKEVLNLASFSNGIYFIGVINDGKESWKKLIVE